jgi:hypothetical protein
VRRSNQGLASLAVTTSPVATATALLIASCPGRAASGDTPLHLSPYYLSGVTDATTTFPAHAGGQSQTSGTPPGAFRVLGAASGGLALSFLEAEAACRELQGGRGLAVVVGTYRSDALQRLLVQTAARAGDVPAPDRFSDDGGASSRMHWIAGVQASTTVAGCADACPAGTASGSSWLWREWLPSAAAVSFRAWDSAGAASPAEISGKAGGGCLVAQLDSASKLGMVPGDCNAHMSRWVSSTLCSLTHCHAPHP